MEEDKQQLEKKRFIESELKGQTLRMYWHILGEGKEQPIGVRSIQRALGLSGPSVALHHLEKLRTLGLLDKDSTGEYHLIETVKVGVLQDFVGIFGLLLPRQVFYATMFSVLLVLYPIVYPPDLSAHNIMALLVTILAVTVSWIEVHRVWRMKPF